MKRKRQSQTERALQARISYLQAHLEDQWDFFHVWLHFAQQAKDGIKETEAVLRKLRKKKGRVK